MEINPNEYDFHGWATRNNIKCSDGRIIMKDAFKHHDGQTIPMVWGHEHNDPNRVLGHALLENREEGVYAYCKFNDTESGKTAKLLVEHGDVNALSICANQLKQQGPYVQHGVLRELSLVLAGANPGAYIETIIKHGEECEDEIRIYSGMDISLFHAEQEDTMENTTLEHSDKTIGDVFNSMSEEQKTVVYAMIGQALAANSGDEAEHSEDYEGGNDTMKQNVFDVEEMQRGNVLTHADQMEIVQLAKQSNVGSLKTAIQIYASENEALQHMDVIDEEGNTNIDTLFPEHKFLKTGAPELLERDLSWVDHVLNSIHKSPISRIRTRYADARIAEVRAKGYQKRGDEKKVASQIKLIGRVTDPQTVYRKDEMHRDDIIDITDFDIVEYMWKLMRHNMNEELALAALIGDGRDEGDPDKIHETHIRSIWHDDDMYTIRAVVDFEAAKSELQGTNTGANFGENYVYAEKIIEAALYAREKYKGSGNLVFYCTPHLVNVMLLARDLNGRRIYNSKADLAAALDVKSIHTIEQFEGKTRTDEEGNEFKLMGLFVNLADYQFGCTKGGEITKFSDFDIDFNKYKYLMETRLSGSLTKLWSAIALEEPVPASAGA